MWILVAIDNEKPSLQFLYHLKIPLQNKHVTMIEQKQKAYNNPSKQ